MGRYGLRPEVTDARTKAWEDSLCDRHAAKRSGCNRWAYTQWRQKQGDMPPNRGMCPVCKAEKRRVI